MPVLFMVRDHLRSLELNDPDVRKQFSVLEKGKGMSPEEDPLFTVLDGLLYHKDSKSSCILHLKKKF